MTTITIDRAVKALEALREASLVWASPEVANAFSVLREALYAPQPEPEPVAWRTFDAEGGWNYRGYAGNSTYRENMIKHHGEEWGHWIEPLYTAPPRREWEPLSLDQISMAWDKAYGQPLSQAALNFARDIEAALKERNHE